MLHIIDTSRFLTVSQWQQLQILRSITYKFKSWARDKEG